MRKIYHIIYLSFAFILFEACEFSETENLFQRETKETSKNVDQRAREDLHLNVAKSHLDTEDNQHFQAIEKLFFEMNDANKNRNEKRLIQKKLQSYFSSPDDKVIEYISVDGETETMSFNDYTRRVRVLENLKIKVGNIELSKDKRINTIYLEEG